MSRADTRHGRIVLAAGGTGGHLFPAQALAEELARRGWSTALFTDERGRRYTEKFPETEIVMTPAATLQGRNPLKLIGAGMKILGGTAAARKHLRRLKPAAIVGFGGYPALPAMIGGLTLGIPVAVHEQNTVLGRVNRLVAGRVAGVASAFPTLKFLKQTDGPKWEVTGNPVRAQVIAAKQPYAPPVEEGPLYLLVFGGSQAAQVFSETVPGAVARLPEGLRARLKVVHQAREDAVASTQTAYESAGIDAEVRPFFGDLPERIAKAHLVMARAGASTVTELAVIGRPSILVPLPSAMDDHQTSNAAWLSESGGAQLLPQAQLSEETLAEALTGWLTVPERLAEAAAAAGKQGRPGATAALADWVESLAGHGRAEAKGRAARDMAIQSGPL